MVVYMRVAKGGRASFGADPRNSWNESSRLAKSCGHLVTKFIYCWDSAETRERRRVGINMEQDLGGIINRAG